jgi:iron complex outermembrane receptor protein
MSFKHTHANPSRALLVLSLIATIVPAAQAQQSPQAGAAEPLQSVIVTGTRALNRRTLDSESPVDIISSRELLATGSSELATVLGRLLPSMNFPRPSGADASDAVRPAQLRGLSPDQTLVLVDGKRRHTSAVINVNGTVGRGSAPADLNAIPLSAIDHVEVLRDGASAQYGSDAIAGVVNIILKKGAAGGGVEATVGQYQEHDGRQKTLRGSTGFRLGDKGWVRVAVEAADRNSTNRAGIDPRPESGPRQGQRNQRFGDPETHPRALFVNGQLQLNDAIEWYAFGNYSQRSTNAAATWRTAYTSVPVAGQPPKVRSAVFPEGFLPLQNSQSLDTALVTGLRGDVAGWRWDASLNYGHNHFDLDLDDTVNLTIGLPREWANQTHFYAGQLLSTQQLANLDVAREIPVSFLAGPLTVALGLEARHESYEIGAGEPASYFGSGSQGFSGFRPQNAGTNSRNNQSVYVNLEGDITKALSGTLAARYEHYSDFGSTTSVKASARYAFTPSFSLRGTASTGFRAPSLAQQFYATTTTNFSVVNGTNVPVDTITAPVNSAAGLTLGSQPLKAEKARNLSLGAQWQPTRNWTNTIDVYRIDIDDRIALSANVNLAPRYIDALAVQGIVGVGAGRYFTNAVDTRTKGVDLVSSYRLNLAGGARADFTAAYNHNKTDVQHVSDRVATLAAANLLLIDLQTLGRLTVATPKDKLSLSTDYTRGIWGGHATLTRYGKFVVPQNNVALNQTFDPQWVLDLSANVRLAGNWQLTGGIDNATNRYPGLIRSEGNLNLNGIQRYSNFSPNGFNGRFYYVKAAYAW